MKRRATFHYDQQEGIPSSPLVPIREFTIPLPDYLDFPQFYSQRTPPLLKKRSYLET